MKHQPIHHERCNRTNGRPRRSIGRAGPNSETQVIEAAGKCKACITRTRRDEAPARGHAGRHRYCTRGHIRNCHCIPGNYAARRRTLVRVLHEREGGCVTASRRSHTKSQSARCGGERPGQLRFHYRLLLMVNDHEHSKHRLLPPTVKQRFLDKPPLTPRSPQFIVMLLRTPSNCFATSAIPSLRESAWFGSQTPGNKRT